MQAAPRSQDAVETAAFPEHLETDGHPLICSKVSFQNSFTSAVQGPPRVFEVDFAINPD